MQHFLRRTCLAIIWITGPSVGVPANVRKIKNKVVDAAELKHQQRQFIRAMKLTAIILLAAALQVSARGYTQTVTISLKNVSLEKVFS
jgi:hypothetical protein